VFNFDTGARRGDTCCSIVQIPGDRALGRLEKLGITAFELASVQHPTSPRSERRWRVRAVVVGGQL
jgi:hypothetical protein